MWRSDSSNVLRPHCSGILSMSTHSALGVQMEDGSIMGCYVHYDGHSMAPRIQRFLEEHTTTDLAILIIQAQALGGIRSFHSADEFGNDPETEYLDDNESYVITSQNWKEDHMGTYAWYLINYDSGETETFQRVYGHLVAVETVS